MRTFHRSVRVLALGLALAACGDDDGTPGADAGADASADAAVPTDAAASDAGADASTAPLAGELQLVEAASPWSAGGQLLGVLSAGGFPVWQEETAREGDCRLLEQIPHFCEQYCEGVCVAENVCEPWPTYASAGALTVTGAKSGISLTPGDYGFMGANVYYWSSDVANLFDDGDPITATFAGAAVPGFSVSASGVAPLIVTSLVNDELALPNGQDVGVAWEAGAADARVRLTLNANSSGGHGSPYEAIIECDTADTGSVTIPRALVEAFPETYRWDVCAGKDCPLSTAVRYRRGSTDIAGGRFELRVGSSVSFWIIHALP